MDASARYKIEQSLGGIVNHLVRVAEDVANGDIPVREAMASAYNLDVAQRHMRIALEAHGSGVVRRALTVG